MKNLRKVLSMLLAFAMVISVLAGNSFNAECNGKTTKAATKAASNTTTIYYKGYSNPNIHYKVGNGNWTSVPGIRMTASTEQTGYTHKAVIELGTETTLTACFNDGNGNWDSQYGKNYTFGVGTYGYSNGNIVNLVTPTATPVVTPTPTAAPEFRIVSINASVPSPQKLGQTIIFSVTTENEAYYRYNTHTYTAIKDGVRKTIMGSAGNVGVWQPTEAGTYTIEAYVKDNEGKEATKTMTYVITEKTSNITTIYYKGYSNPNIHYKMGNKDWTNVPGVALVKSTEQAGYTHKAVIDLGTETTLTACFNDGNGNWDSQYGKNYTFGVGTYGYSNGNIVALVGPSASPVVTVGPTATPVVTVAPTATPVVTAEPTATPVITPEPVHAATIYYGNESYNNANIHYQVEGKNWTKVPGIKMSSSTEKEGYQYKYVIDLGTADYANVCFNDGNGNWDSNHGNNFKIYAGTYGVKNDTVTDLAESGKLEITSLFTDLKSPQSTGSDIFIRGEVRNGVGNVRYSYSVEKDGVVTRAYGTTPYNGLWQPQEEGIYTISLKVTDEDGNTDIKSIPFVVKNIVSNKTTIYYEGYNNAYIHYKVGSGNWTAVPGLKMTETSERSGYSYKAVIDLGEATTLTACFNNGDGLWDSNSGKNYSFSAGTYTVKDGIVTKVNK